MASTGGVSRLDDASEATIASLPPGISEGLLHGLRANVSAPERLQIIAGAHSPKSGIVVLTSARLLFLYTVRRLRPELMLAAFPRVDLRGARREGTEVLVLRFGRPPIRFTDLVPTTAAHLIVDALGPPAVDACTDTVNLDKVSQRLRDELSSRIPDSEHLCSVVATPDGSGAVGLTDVSFLWLRVQADGQVVADDGWTRSTPPREALSNPPQDLREILCLIYEFLRDSDAVLDLSSGASFLGAELYKARALALKGLSDAALVVYDGAIRDGKRRGIRLEYIARYAKAGLLINTGNVPRARRELARLYADDPSFEDTEGLLDRVSTVSLPSGREPIPEQVRHAVWRRDQGQCVQCGSRERLEYDHVIPVSRGGSHSERNLQLLCERCNRQKAARI